MFARRKASFTILLTALGITACGVGTNADDIPTTARVEVVGNAPDELQLIVSRTFFEQLNLTTGERTAVLQQSDTLALGLPYDVTWDLNSTGSIYVELLYEESTTASVTLSVNLDNGESFEQAANMSAGAQLIYYWIWQGQG